MSKLKRLCTSIFIPLLLGYLVSQVVVLLAGEMNEIRRTEGLAGEITRTEGHRTLEVNKGTWRLQRDKGGIRSYSKKVEGTYREVEGWGRTGSVLSGFL